MADMGIAVSNRVIARNSMGQFIAACEKGATATVERAIQKGATLSRAMAPKGHKPDPRTIPLAASIKSEMVSATAGHWYADARHALPQELSAAPHEITGRVSFFWEREGRQWHPGDNMIQHPGNPAQPYLRPAYKVVMGEIMAIAAEEFPG